MLLLTSFKVHTENIQTAVLKYGPNEMRSVQKNLRSEYFPYGGNNWSIKGLLYSHNKTHVKSLECCRIVLRKILGKLMKFKIKAISMKI